MARLCHDAVTRLVAKPDRWKWTPHLFTPAEREELIRSFEALLATGDLLGRARVRERLYKKAGAVKFAEPEAGEFPPGTPRITPVLTVPVKPLPPVEALNYFRGLELGINQDPGFFGDLIRRRAFTLAVSTDAAVLDSVRNVIAERLQFGTGTIADVQDILDEAGVSSRNPQYCFLPDTLVEGAVLAASKARYDGPIVHIQTNDGRRLSVTINHPILTADGWKRAGDLGKSDYLVCYGDPVESFDAGRLDCDRREWSACAASYGGGSIGTLSRVRTPSARRAVNNQQIPARIEDVFETILVQSSAGCDIQSPCRPLDFYGDAEFFDGNVHCVWANRKLMNRSEAYSRKFRDQTRFMERNNIAADAPSVRSGLLDARLYRPSDANLACGEFGNSRSLFIGRHALPVDAHLFGSAANLNPECFKSLDKRMSGDVTLARKMVKSLAGLVSLRRVVDVEHVSWSGHVYDLQTCTGLIVSQGIVSSNCEMIMRTNMADATNQAFDEELKDPDVVESFPVWKYINPDDERTGEDHRPLIGNYYPNRAAFAAVRGERAFNCRCAQEPIYVDDWLALQEQGAEVQEGW